MALTGHCNCGAVRFEIDEPLVSASYCHCTRCQRRTGNAYGVSAAIVPGSLRVVAGEEHLKTWTPQTGNPKTFCDTCGSGLWSSRPDGGPIAGIRLALIDGDPGVRPSLHHWVESAACWEPIADDGLPRHEGPRPS